MFFRATKMRKSSLCVHTPKGHGVRVHITIRASLCGHCGPRPTQADHQVQNSFQLFSRQSLVSKRPWGKLGKEQDQNSDEGAEGQLPQAIIRAAGETSFCNPGSLPLLPSSLALTLNQGTSIMWLNPCYGWVGGFQANPCPFLLSFYFKVDTSGHYCEEQVAHGSDIPALPAGVWECRQLIKPLRQLL